MPTDLPARGSLAAALAGAAYLPRVPRMNVLAMPGALAGGTLLVRRLEATAPARGGAGTLPGR